MPSENRLFPIFLKIGQLNTLLVGGGKVGLEKLGALLKNDPEVRLTIVAKEASPELKAAIARLPHIVLHERPFVPGDLDGKQLVIVATDNRDFSAEVYAQAKSRGILTNVADTPDLCDFYLGATVTKGNLKIGISTNGQSPTFAKRFRQVLEEALPDETNQLLANLNQLRNRLQGSFAEKIRVLNATTQELLTK
jgi:siroheme synthase-like protein